MSVTDPNGVFLCRERWPLGVPLRVLVETGAFLGERSRTLRAKGALGQAKWIVEPIWEFDLLASLGPDLTWDDRTHLAGVPGSASDGVALAYSVRGRGWRRVARIAVAKGVTVLPVRIGGAVGDIMTGVSLPDLDRSLATALDARFHRRGLHSDGEARLLLGMMVGRAGTGAQNSAVFDVLATHPEVTFAALFEVIHAGRVVARTRGWWRGRTSAKGQLGVSPMDGPARMRVSIEIEGLDEADVADGRWSLRVASDPEMALRDFDSSAYWLGDVVVPLRVTDISNWEELKREEEGR